MNITTTGIDLAKNTFSLHSTDALGKTMLKKTVSRSKLLSRFANIHRNLPQQTWADCSVTDCRSSRDNLTTPGEVEL